MPLFDLTKREQRVVIVIMVVLVGGTVAFHYHDLRTPMPAAKSSSSPAPFVAGDEEDAAPNETASPADNPVDR